jgi:hypothetical protein
VAWGCAAGTWPRPGGFHLACEDPENLFAFAFRTPPPDDSGVAHILEHSVLCGSRRFPVKDPFVVLLKSSLQTFLNAFTFPDKTVYPAASQLEKDYFHLLEVYGDAVFFPRLDPEVFRQEGHRLELAADGSLNRVGVVYNEMKGSFSSAKSSWRTCPCAPCSRRRMAGIRGLPAVPGLTYEGRGTSIAAAPPSTACFSCTGTSRRRRPWSSFHQVPGGTGRRRAGPGHRT